MNEKGDILLQKIIDETVSSTSSYENAEIELRIMFTSDLNRGESKFQGFSRDRILEYSKSVVGKLSEMLAESKTTAYTSAKDIFDNVQETINLIDNVGNQSYIKQLVFIGGMQDKTRKSEYCKKRMIEPLFILDNDGASSPAVKLAISDETQCDLTKLGRPFVEKLARAKLRFSIPFGLIHPDYDSWQLDVTLVKSSKMTDFDSLKKMRDALFPKIKMTKLDQIPWSSADTVEIELEWMGFKNGAKTDSVKKSSNNTAKHTEFDIDELKVIDKYFELFPVTADNTDQASMLKSVARLMNITLPHTMYTGRPGIATHQKISLKYIGNQPFEMSRNRYIKEVLPLVGRAYITLKADGERAFLYHTGIATYVLTSKEVIVLANSNTSQHGTPKIATKYLYDGEYIKSLNKIYLFDVMIHDGQPVHTKIFSERLPILGKCPFVNDGSSGVKGGAKGDMYSTRIVDGDTVEGGATTLHDCKVAVKPYLKWTDPKVDVKALLSQKVDFETDGIIYVLDGESYAKTLNYKWKPLEKLTIDFVAKKCKPPLLGTKPFVPKKGKTLYLLFSHVRSTLAQAMGIERIKNYNEYFTETEYSLDYYPVPFSPSLKPYAYLYWHPDKKSSSYEVRQSKASSYEVRQSKETSPDDTDDLDSKVVEMHWSCDECEDSSDMEDGKWELYRVRADKTEGNNFMVAELAWSNYYNPLDRKTIEKDPSLLTSEGYFQIDDNQDYRVMRGFNSFVKNHALAGFRKSKWVLDLASGKGQDLGRYQSLEVENGLFVEIDKGAICELIERKYDIAKSQVRYAETSKQRISSYKIHALLGSVLESDINELIDNYPLPTDGVGLIVCNFAFHYFMESKRTISHMVKLISKRLAKGGHFVMTSFDGEAIVRLLGDKKEWRVQVGETDKYHIKKLYSGSELSQFGQKIAVKLPFSKAAYEEYLVNISYLETLFAKEKIKLIKRESFGRYLGSFNQEDMLSADDKAFCSLYYVYEFVKDMPAQPKPRSAR